MRKNVKFLAMFLAAAISVAPVASVYTPQTTVYAAEKATKLKEGWNTVGKKKYFVKNGKVQTKWLTYKKQKYYLDPAAGGAMVTGLKKISGKQYYFTSTGKLVTSKYGYKIKTKYYQINSKGELKALSKVEGMAGAQIDKQGKSLRKAFNWSAKLPYTNPGKPSSSQSAAEFYGTRGFVYKKGDCNVQAYTLYWMAKRMGYSAKVIQGYVPQANGKYGKHAWVEITIKGKKYVFDPNLASTYGLDKGYQFHYGDKGTYRYYDKNKKPITK